jgi:transposase InsO family protein
MTVARFVADQRTRYRVPHAACCRLLGVSESWFYKWADRAATGALTPSETRRRAVDEAVSAAFGNARGKHGSPRLLADLRDAGHTVSGKTVASSMRRQGLIARRIKRRRNTTKPDRTKKPFPDLLRRDFTARGPNVRWVGDMTEIPVDGHGKFYLATVIDLYSRRCLAASTSLRADATLARAAIQTAVAARGGPGAIRNVMFHTDRGSTYTADRFTSLCRQLEITQSMGRVGSCFDNAAAEAFFSSLEWEALCDTEFRSLEHAQAVVQEWCYGFYNHVRRHSHNLQLSPVNFEALAR